MGNQVNHKQFMNKVSMYLDNDMSQVARQALLKEIEANPTSNDMLNQERVFREFLKAKLPRKKVSPTLIQSIKEKVGLSAPPA